MTDSYAYTRRRAEINRPVSFSDSRSLRVACLPDPEARTEPGPHAFRDPNVIELGNFPQYSENIVNTDRVITLESTVLHSEGGWPKEVDITDRNEMKKYIKKKLEKHADNTDKFTAAVRKLTENVESILLRNNEIDMFEEYFPGETAENGAEALSLKTLTLFRRPQSTNTNSMTAAVSSLSWHPDGPGKIAVSYAVPGLSTRTTCVPEATVWDVSAPNSPVETLTPPFPLTKLAFNHKNVEQIAFGCSSGIVGLWDVRVNRHRASQVSPVENSHHEAVVDLAWLSSKGGSEFVSCSTDGSVKWWDFRQMEKPTDELHIAETSGADAGKIVLGATALEYVADYGPKYLLGTESGAIVLATKKPKKAAEINFNSCYGVEGIGRHLGPVFRIARNPFFPRYFFSLGDWSVNIWEDDLKTPITHSRYHQALLADAAWSPSRPGIYAVARRDGWIDIWDLYFRQNVVALSHRASSAPLTCLRFNNAPTGNTTTSQVGDAGKFLAVGDANETVTLLKLCKPLYRIFPDEKGVITEILDREKVREELFKKHRIEKSKLQKDREKQDKNKIKDEEKARKELEKLEQDFETLILNKQKDLSDVFEQEVVSEPSLGIKVTTAAIDSSNLNESTFKAAADEASKQKKIDSKEEGGRDSNPQLAGNESVSNNTSKSKIELTESKVEEVEQKPVEEGEKVEAEPEEPLRASQTAERQENSHHESNINNEESKEEAENERSE